MRKSASPARPLMGSPSPATREILAGLLRDAALGLFDALGLRFTTGGAFDPSAAVWSDPVSFLGFGGDAFAGSLVVSAPWPLMALTTPTVDRAPEALADWSRELANMLVGGFKLALLERGHHVQIGLPTSIVSTDLRIATSTPEAIGERFEAHGHSLLVALDCIVAPALTLDELPNAYSKHVVGDVLLF